MTSNYELQPADEQALTEWMTRSLRVTACTSEVTPLRDIEKRIVQRMKPPMDAERSALWSPNPWRTIVVDGRKRLREAARSLDA